MDPLNSGNPIGEGVDNGPVTGSASVDRSAAALVSLFEIWEGPKEPAAPKAKLDLSQALLDAGAVQADKVSNAENVLSKTPGKSLVEIYREMGVDELAIQNVLVQDTGYPLVRVDADDFHGNKMLQALGLDYCYEQGVVPINKEGLRAIVGFVNPQDIGMIDEISHRLGAMVKPVVVTMGDIHNLIDQLKAANGDQTADNVSEIIADIDEEDVEVVEEDKEDLDLEKAAEESPVIRLVNYIIAQAVKEGASDIHIEPMEKRLQVRFRIDGVLFDAMNPPAAMRNPIISRLKIMSNLDISERRLPQDGRIRCVIHGRKLDLRLSTLPVQGGEKAVMRILDNRSVQVELDDLGFNEDMLHIWKGQIKNPHGIILVTGPTGSGKTTTLYSSLNQMDRNRLNISTVEDPVEYHLDGVNQTQTHDKIGMSFAAALRALLRQDPDVVMVGEIRDMDTAKTAIQASLTGHLVLSTLHTNDAPSSVTRLINIGVEPFLIGSAVNGCLAQRLVRKICQHCKTQKKLEETEADVLAMHGISPDKVLHGEGCDKCRNTGYSGRVGIYELLVMDDFLRDMIAANPNVTEFRRICVERGMTTLRADGFDKVLKGVTTVEEVFRVTEANS